MATRKRKLKFGSKAWRAKYAHKANTGRRRRTRRTNTHHRRRSTRRNTGAVRRNYGRRHTRRNTGRRRSNPGVGSIGEIVTTSTFVLVGGLGSKFGAQLILGSNNAGPLGYAMNLGVGAVLWFAADKVMKNKTAASGIVAGTVAQLIFRLINDFTPFGTYLSGLGMGDYQAQSYVTPQILTDPTRNSNLLIPNGWGQPALPSPAAMVASKGVSGTYDDMTGGNLFGGSSY